MCQITLISGPDTNALVADLPQCQSVKERSSLKVLLCSENVPPQVNGIARRIGMYADGLEKLGCDVGELTL